MYSRQGRGVAFQQHLLYKLVSVECCGIEQQFSVLVLTLNPGPLALDDLLFKSYVLASAGVTLTYNPAGLWGWGPSCVTCERTTIVRILYLSSSNIIQIYTHVLLLYGVSLPSLCGPLQHQHLPEAQSPVHSLDLLSFYLDLCTWRK